MRPVPGAVESADIARIRWIAMSLPHFTLLHASALGRWELVEDATGRVWASYASRGQALAGGALEAAVGQRGGVVDLQAFDGSPAERRTLPQLDQAHVA